MEKRYQVFVSSTYADLQDERRNVIQTLMEMDCIPSGMEIFPAADEEQWEFIKKVISDCDYYLLIIGGRYGSITPEGISYTEKEYEYAVSIGLKILAFLHKKPEEIPAKNTEMNPELQEKLISFRERVSAGRLVRFWENANELPGLVALSLTKTIKTYPAIGWVRANRIANNEILTEINDLRKKNQELEILLSINSSVPDKPLIENLAGIEEKFVVSGTYSFELTDTYHWASEITWSEIFAIIAPYLLEQPSDSKIQQILAKEIFETSNEYQESTFSVYIDNKIYQTIKIQLIALNLINIEYTKTTEGSVGFWNLTNNGEDLLFQLRTIKKEMD